MKKISILSLVPALLLCLIPLAAMAQAAPAPRPEIDLTPLFQAVIALLAALITGRLLPWIKARTTLEQQERLEAATRTLVYAAEQLYKTGVVKDKLLYVEESLRARGYEVDRDAIEAAVRGMNFSDGIFLSAGQAHQKEEALSDE